MKFFAVVPQQRLLSNVTDLTSSNSNSTDDWWSAVFNQTSFNQDVDELNSFLHPASDVDINEVVTSAVFNSIVFVAFMISYEVLRRCFPNVYASKQSREARLGHSQQDQEEEDLSSLQKSSEQSRSGDIKGSSNGLNNSLHISSRDDTMHASEGQAILDHMKKRTAKYSKLQNLPDVYKSDIPLQWVMPVFNIPWRQVREQTGLDAYFFLRYIRMCFKITSVSALWGMVTLFPVYAYGDNGACGWYHFSMANVSQGSLIIWIAVFYIYFFSFYVLFIIKQEYKHFVQLRLDFLGNGDGSTNLQHHYSLMVENIPKELRSDSALFAYFNKLFPGKVHSASIMLELPELEKLSERKLRITRRLEKSIAHYEATGERPTHVTGRFRPMICGVESTPVEWCCDSDKVVDIDEVSERELSIGQSSGFGIRVDSIEYYTRDLESMNVELFQLQSKKSQIAAYGNKSVSGAGWFSVLSEYAEMFFNDELSDGEEDNNQKRDEHDDSSTYSTTSGRVYNRRSTWKPASRRYLFQEYYGDGPAKRDHSSHLETGVKKSNSEESATRNNLQYGSLENDVKNPSNSSNHSAGKNSSEALRTWFTTRKKVVSFKGDKDGTESYSSKEEPLIMPKPPAVIETKRSELSDLYRQSDLDEESNGKRDLSASTASTDSTPSIASKRVSKTAARLGFDFLIYLVKFIGQQCSRREDDPKEDVMSSTGFVTFLDLGTVTSVANTPLTHKPRTLNIQVAPEPRDILWDNCSCTSEVNEKREIYANIFLVLGAVLWSVPLASIQAFASAEQVAKLPGMQWITEFDEGRLKSFINVYLPVVALLSLIMILPIIFETIAISYEKRKTMSDVDKSVVSRYFYYQLANIYITVTAGSIWISASEIIERPSYGLEILGNSLPTVVGYFISLLVTKILGGLPMVILRVGALSRYLILRLLHRTKFLTQRELDNVYLVEPVYYGYEYPTQMLVIVICFTYACISPIILVFGALYFFAALMVYKKQVLYVYSCSYESGGDLFPLVCDRTIFGLICGQLTFMGYSIVRGGHFSQVLSVLPLILFTLWIMKYFRVHFAEPSKRLTLELALELDRKIEQKSRAGSPRSNHPLFDSNQDINASARDSFDRNYYKQPVLTEPHGEPMFYRIGRKDPLTKATIDKLRSSRLHMWHAGRKSDIL